jgi:hypothetical protein
MRVDESGLVQSVRARLLATATAAASDPNTVLARYGIERFLYRLSLSPHADRFVLKGAMLLSAWLGENARPTRDIDLLGLGRFTLEELAEIGREVCTIECEADGMSYAPETVKVAEIRTSGQYRGARLTLSGALGRARVKVQVDVGIGDATTPGPAYLDYPSLLGFPHPRLRAYQPETVVAEKVHAMTVLASANTRLKDVHDVAMLCRHVDFDGTTLAAAVAATFSRRNTEISGTLPTALTAEFAANPARQTQWKAFLKRSRLDSGGLTLAAAAEEAARFIEPVLAAATAGEPFTLRWKAPGPWRRGGGSRTSVGRTRGRT